MAKQIRWRVPFASVSGTQYEVEIYDENWTGSPVVLTAGATPFVTDEDASDDFFAPVRSQTGTLQVCTLLEDGTMLRLEDILPDNNIARPVQLRRVADNVVEWQGFLSCEAYTQDYIGIPQVLDLSLISVLEAMDSVECDPTKLNGVQRVYNIIGYAFDQMQQSVGMHLLQLPIYFGGMGENILYKFINTSLFYDMQEQDDENYSEAILKGIPLKELLTKLATFMGWVVRENGMNIYFQTAGGDSSMLYAYVEDLLEDQPTLNHYIPTDTMEIADLTWRGAHHTKSVCQGARNVEVVVNMTSFDIEVGIPDGFPQGEYLTGSLDYVSEGTGEEGADENVTLEAYASKEQGFNNRCEFKNWYQEDISDAKPLVYTEQGTVSDIFADTIIGHESSLNPIGDQYLGAFMARLKNDEIDYDKTGLYVNAYWANTPDNVYILRMMSIDHLNAYNGKFILKVDGISIDANPTAAPFSHIVRGIRLAIKWGGLYLQDDKKTWGSAFAYNDFEWNEENHGEIEIPINSYNYGEVEMFLLPHSLTWWQTDMASYTVDEFMFTELSLTYQAPEDVFEDRDANHYFEALKTAFRDEVSVGCDFGSSLNNLPNPSIILNRDPYSAYEPLTTMEFYDGKLTTMRPEKHLLNRLATYYSKPRTNISVEVEHPLTPLPQLRMIDNGKCYLPIAHSRDWNIEQTTLHLMETTPWLEVYFSDGKPWDTHYHYILLHGSGDSVTIQLSSPVELHWADRDFQLQSVYINGKNGIGTIPAGDRVNLKFVIEDEVNERGTIDIYRGTELVFSIDVVAEY
jgi:hypothetical protein